MASSPNDAKTAPSSSTQSEADDIPRPKEQPTSDAAPDQCGLENDGIAYVKRETPGRKLVTETSPEKLAKYRAILAEIFDEKCAVWGRKVDFEPRDLIEICVEVRKYLESEPMFIEDVEAPVTIVGDIHGHLHDLDKVFKYHSVDYKPGYECGRFLFLGDYIERGRQSIEVLAALFILKILYPSQFIILRGNHEFVSVNHEDFAQDIRSRYPHETSRCLYAIFNGTFAWMSICAIVGGKIFCVHGGISNESFTKSSLRNLRKPLLLCTDSHLVVNLVWSDPAEGLQGTCFNGGRHSSIYYGEDAFAYAMDAIDCIAMFRGHTRIMAGASVLWDRCITIFSCVDSCLSYNKGSFAQLDKDLNCKIGIMPVDLTRHRVYQELKDKVGDELTVADEEMGTGDILKIDN